MKNKFVLIISFCVLAAACSSSKKNSGAMLGNSSYPTSVPKPEDDGLSFEKAIVITETSETKGVNAEYLWLKDHYKGHKVKSQSLSFSNKKPYDIITITTADDKELKVYFDISNYFGKL